MLNQAEYYINFLKQNFSNTKILVVGDIMLDRYYFSKVDRISPEAPVPIAQVQNVEDRSGGAANVANNLATLGTQVSLLTIAGQDDSLHNLGAMLKLANVNLIAITSLQIKTTIKLRVVSKNQQLLRIDFEDNIADNLSMQQELLIRFKQIVRDFDLIIFSDYNKGVLYNIEAMLNICRQFGVKTLVDPKGDNYNKYCNANIITPNVSELSLAVSGFESETIRNQKITALIQDLNLSYLLLTKSEYGMELFYINNDQLRLKTFPAITTKTVYDVSGAGDTVIAVLGLILASNKEFTIPSLSVAIVIANIAASIVISKFGTANVSIDEIISEIHKHPYENH